jgi:hypothetical protein
VPTLGLPDFDGGDDGDYDDDDDVFVNVDFDVDVDVDVDVLGDADADLLFISLSPLSLLNVAKPLLLCFIVLLSLWRLNEGDEREEAEDARGAT